LAEVGQGIAGKRLQLKLDSLKELQ
jgi:hypothetical protein